MATPAQPRNRQRLAVIVVVRVRATRPDTGRARRWTDEQSLPDGVPDDAVRPILFRIEPLERPGVNTVLLRPPALEVAVLLPALIAWQRQDAGAPMRARRLLLPVQRDATDAAPALEMRRVDTLRDAAPLTKQTARFATTSGKPHELSDRNFELVYREGWTVRENPAGLRISSLDFRPEVREDSGPPVGILPQLGVLPSEPASRSECYVN
jgi:hypothetical protein